MSQFLINENMKMPAEAVAITGGSILGLLLGGTAECRCTSRLIGSFRPSVRRNAKPRWSWSPVRRESCRRVGPATAERRPIVCIVDDSRDLWSSDTSFSDIAEPASPGSCMVDTIRGAALAAPRVHVPLQRAPLQGAWEALRASGSAKRSSANRVEMREMWRVAASQPCLLPFVRYYPTGPNRASHGKGGEHARYCSSGRLELRKMRRGARCQPRLLSLVRGASA